MLKKESSSRAGRGGRDVAASEEAVLFSPRSVRTLLCVSCDGTALETDGRTATGRTKTV
jgi:hypothetical protein